ncbi:MAG: LysR substrate-binding domain-containing protein [Pollutimonas bauzanensis]|uniref:DNA-binding transcriptional regulator, LysR family n=1 Tax=Pollutimonas bauzanensis TaxID=658167 RepID=A0A1M5X6W6_9BURK|nr:LysR substrate-binding domain-containing protein [Pollutimonas bauzanensis]SHH95392.1 DNA-binding transcriptional regulator, LysR family [Pollutimonas bauzanensis]
MHLTVRQMEVIRAVSRHGSVGEAASALGVSQPAVSLMLRECALQAGFPFFVRKRGRLQATRETLEIMGELNRLFDGIARVNRLVGDMRTLTEGTIQIATVPTIAENLLTPTSVKFREEWPQIQISVIATDNVSVSDHVFQERVDFGIVLAPLSEDGRMIEGRLIDLCEAELVCVVPEESPLARLPVLRPQDLAPYPLISFNKNLPLGALVEESYRMAGVKRKIALEVTLTAVAYSLARSGAGVAIIDPFYLLTGRNQGVATVRYEPRTPVKAQLLLPNNTSLSRPAQLFVAALKKTAVALNERLPTG